MSLVMPADRGRRPVRIANCSGFFGDRLSAAEEQVSGGPIDVLTGDWLAELTMLILHKQRARDPELGYAATFVTQAERVLATCIERGIRVVTNAGGLNPAGCARRIREVADRLGIAATVMHVEGDDLLPRVDELRPHLTHLDDGRPLDGDVLTANAYLGGWGVATALAAGAEVVVCGRITDASLVVGPSAWWWDWAANDWDALAGAVVAGHVVECGAQCTGGNYSFFNELPSLTMPLGFPIAEIDCDGSSVITKHSGTGGAVTTDTVTAQLLYEIDGAAYANPDVVARFDSVRVEPAGSDRVRIHGVRGQPAPERLKVCLNRSAGWRNRMTFVMSGLDQEAKARWVSDALFASLGGRDLFDQVDERFVAAPIDGRTQEETSGRLHIAVTSRNATEVGRRFSAAAVELALANYPGFFTVTPPGDRSEIGVYWPALVPRGEVTHSVVRADGSTLSVVEPPATSATQLTIDPPKPVAPVGPAPGELLGHFFGARSGDKGGNANVGVWARDDAGYAWLAANLTEAAVRTLIPEVGELTIRRAELPLLRAVNIVIVGFLGEGVAANTAFDPQAKGLGEFLRSRRWLV